MKLVNNPIVTRVFRAGNSQAVRIPKAFELEEGEVFIERRGNTLYITPKRGNWESFFTLPPIDIELDFDSLRDTRAARSVELGLDLEDT